MTALKVALFVVCITGSHAWLFSGSGPAWDGLKVTWGINPLSSYTFAAMPRTMSDAVKAGWKQLSPFSSGTPFCGTRMIHHDSKLNADDPTVILIYDKNGFIAGIQTGFPDNTDFPSKFIQPPMVHIGRQFFMTAYFVESDVVCGSGRTQEQYNSQGTGTTLNIQNSTNPTVVIRIPMEETSVDTPQSYFTKGQCFWTMGDHYWASTAGKVVQSSRCDQFFPMFLLYNKGKLNGFGWAFLGNFNSPRYEHPGASVLNKFLPSPVPDCLKNVPHFSTMHIYMTNSPSTNFC